MHVELTVVQKSFRLYVVIMNTKTYGGEILILKKEPTNVSDRLAVCIQIDGQIVGHMPRNLAPLIYYFLVRDVNKGMAEITGMPLNRGTGMGMEVPCIYRLHGPEVYITRLQDMVKKDRLHETPTPSI